MKTELNISGMSCSHCVSAVKTALLTVPGVTAVEVSLEPGLAVVDHEAATPVASLIEAVKEEGYGASENEPH